MNFFQTIGMPFYKENKKKGIIVIATVVVLAGIILVLILMSYFSINAIRLVSFSFENFSQAFLNAQSCLSLAIDKLRANPAYYSLNQFEKVKEGKIECQYLIENEEGGKTIKSEGKFGDYFKKIVVKLK